MSAVSGAAKPSVLIPDAHTRAMLASIRSLGRAGYDTHVVAASPDAMGLRSNYARQACVTPSYDNPGFLDWLADYCRRHQVRMIVPSSGMLQAVRPRFAEFKPLLPVADDPDIVYRAGDKIAAYEAYQSAPPELRLLHHHPATLVARRGQTVTADRMAGFRAPIFVKSKHSLWECASVEEAVQRINALLGDGPDELLVQSGVEGVQVGVSALMGPDGPLALNCVCDSHPRPHSKGTMSLRHTRWLQQIVDDAVNRLTALQWQGCAMVEYRWIPETNEFNVIEINARFWQYLHLDIHSGIDFPRLLAEWHLEGRVMPPPPPRQGVVCRDTFPGEVAQLVNELRLNRTRPLAATKAVAGFVGRFFDPRIKADLWFDRDRLLYLRELRRFVRQEFRHG